MSEKNMPRTTNMEGSFVKLGQTTAEVESTLPIPKPNATYLAATREIEISGLPYGSMHDFITDGTFTVYFGTPLEKRGPVPLGWATWSSPPFSESATPDVLVCNDNALTMALSAPVSIFGFELEPNSFATFSYTADFYHGETLIDSITRDVDGDAGTRLFARSGDPIDSVIVSGPDSFAIAQVRLQEVVQDQNRILQIFGALLAILIVASLIR